VKRAHYRVTRYPLESGDRFVGLVWNYDQSVLVSTGDYGTYTDARAALQESAAALGIELAWFDGEYVFNWTTGEASPAPWCGR
jgi:hypothetical protein